MSFRIWHKAIATALSLLMVFGHIPITRAPLSDQALASVAGAGLNEEPTDQNQSGEPLQPEAASQDTPVSETTSTAPAVSEDPLAERPSVTEETSSSPGEPQPAEAPEPVATETENPTPEQPAETKDPASDGMVLQRSAYTCGPAALATLLKMLGSEENYYEAITRIVSIGQHGTTLLDLKRSAEALGYQAEGYRKTIDELVLSGPVLAHVVIGGYHHFTVVEGVVGETVFMADPQLGRVNVSLEQFKTIWSGAVLKVSGAKPVEAVPSASQNEHASTTAEQQTALPENTQPGEQTLTPEGVTGQPADVLSAEAGAPATDAVVVTGTEMAAPESAECTAAAPPCATGTTPAPTQQDLPPSRQLLDEAEMGKVSGRGIFLVPLAAKAAPKGAAALKGAVIAARAIMHNHHIVARAHRLAADSRAVLRRFARINDPINIVRLPADYHRRLPHDYYRFVDRVLRDVTTRRQFERAMDFIRGELERGRTNWR